MDKSFEEAGKTMAILPLNIAFCLSNFAKNEGIQGYEIDTLGQIVKLLNKPDYRSMVVHDATFTANGFWGELANNVHTSTSALRPTSHLPIEFQYDEASSSMSFAPRTLEDMREILRFNNSCGNSAPGIDLSYQPSSGCPIRHTQPHFGKTEADNLTLEMLSQAFDKPVEELAADRGQTAIENGLDALAIVLEHAQAIQNSKAVGSLALTE